MHSKYLKIVIVIISFIIVICLFKNENNEYERGEVDKEEFYIEEPVLSIKDGIPYATDRAKSWRSGLYLDYIKVAFNGVDEIQNKKGVIMYDFYEDAAKKNEDAEGSVLIDMNKNSIISFESSYGSARVLIGGSGGLQTDEWVIDIDEAVSIAFDIIGEDKILNHSNPNLVIRCWQKHWEIAVIGDKYDDYRIGVNPENGDVTEIYDSTINE